MGRRVINSVAPARGPREPREDGPCVAGMHGAPPTVLFTEERRLALGDSYTEIALEPLSERDVSEMASYASREWILDRRPRSRNGGAVGGLTVQARGVRSRAVESGGLCATGNGWARHPDDERALGEDTVDDVVSERIGFLGDKTRQVLGEAAIVGRSFDYGLLHDITGAPDTLNGSIANLMAPGLLEADAVAPSRRYAFKHELTQQAAYECLDEGHRSELHNRLAVVLETEYADDAPMISERLAFHYQRGLSLEKALQYLLLAAGRASISSRSRSHNGTMRRHMSSQWPRSTINRSTVRCCWTCSTGGRCCMRTGVSTTRYGTYSPAPSFGGVRRRPAETGDVLCVLGCRRERPRTVRERSGLLGARGSPRSTDWATAPDCCRRERDGLEPARTRGFRGSCTSRLGRAQGERGRSTRSSKIWAIRHLRWTTLNVAGLAHLFQGAVVAADGLAAHIEAVDVGESDVRRTVVAAQCRGDRGTPPATSRGPLQRTRRLVSPHPTQGGRLRLGSTEVSRWWTRGVRLTPRCCFAQCGSSPVVATSGSSTSFRCTWATASRREVTFTRASP